MTSTTGEARCACCGAPLSATPVWVKHGYAIHACTGCGVRMVWPTPGADELAAVYTAAYFQRGDKYSEAARRAAARNDAFKLGLIRTHRTGGSLLDVGCATGSFLAAAREAGFAISGVEPAGSAAATASERLGLPVHAGDLASAAFPSGRFEVATLWDVIEHVTDPSAVIAETARVLAPGGVLVVSTGDIASPWARLTGARWPLLTPPQHLSYFTRDSLCRLLARHGFDVVSVRHPGKWVTLGFALFKAVESWGRWARPLAALIRRLGMDGWRLYLNFGDIMTVVAVKRGEG